MSDVLRWDGTASRYSDEQYAAACALDRSDCGDGSDLPTKERYSLPYKNPGSSTPDPGGVAAAAQRLNQVNACPAAKKKAAKRLVSAYRSLGNDPPSNLMEMAGMNGRKKEQDGELVRAVYPGPQFEEESDGMHVRGYFVPFDTWTEINSPVEGHFLERVRPGSFSKTFQERAKAIQYIFEHGQDPQIGLKPIGAVDELREEQGGAHYEVSLLDAPYVKDVVLPGMKAGLYGTSFRFKPVQEDVDYRPRKADHNPEGLPERTITEVMLREFGPTSFPAYSGTEPEIRSATHDWLMQSVDLSRYKKIEPPNEEEEEETSDDGAEAPEGRSDRPPHAVREQSLFGAPTRRPTWKL